MMVGQANLLTLSLQNNSIVERHPCYGTKNNFLLPNDRLISSIVFVCSQKKMFQFFYDFSKAFRGLVSILKFMNDQYLNFDL